MKRSIITTVLVMIIICNLFMIPVMVSATTPITIPADWQLLGSETFNGASSNTLLTAYTSANSPSLITGSRMETNTYTGTKPTVSSSTGQLTIYGKSNSGTSVKGTLANAIDLTGDADYYLMVDGTFPSWNYSGIMVGLGYNDTVAAKYKEYDFGTYQNNSTQVPRITQTNTNDSSYNSAKARPYNWNTMQTMLVQISCRSSKLDTMKLRFFDNESTETPSFSPNYWDIEHQVDLTNVARFEEFWIKGSNNSGSEQSAKLDNIYIYKAAPMCGYTTTGTNYGTSTKYMVGLIVNLNASSS